MLSFVTSWLPSLDFLPGWFVLDTNPINSVLQGVVGACGISLLCSLLRLHLFLQKQSQDDPGQKTSGPPSRTGGGLRKTLYFTLVTLILALVGSRVASLVVLEFCLRGVSGWISSGPESGPFLQKLLVQSQFSLGCALSCSLHFLHDGASQRWLCLVLAAGLSGFLTRQASRLLRHVHALYPLHSSQRYCGVCIALLTSGRLVLPALTRAAVVTFGVAVLASVSIINRHFLSAGEALKFWTPLTICYTLLVVYMQEEQHRRPAGQSSINAVVVRLGGLLVLMLTVGRWTDVLHILVCFLGEATCLVPTLDLLDAVGPPEEEDHEENLKERQRRTTRREKQSS